MAIWWISSEDIVGRLDAIDTKLNAVLKLQQETKELVMSEQEEIANLVEEVSANRDAVQSATIAMEGLVSQVATLSQQLNDAIANSSDVSPEIKAAAEALAVNTAALEAAIPQLAQAVGTGLKK
jgi:predicted  nucleic acid-binding Zn-ribbon protein